MKNRLSFQTSVFFLFLLLILSVDFSFSQSYQTFKTDFDFILENTRWRAGPFRIFPRVVFREVGFDNNVYHQHERNDPIGDFTFTLALPIIAHLLLKDWMIFSFNVTPEYVFFAQEERERSFNISYSPYFKMLLLQRFVLSGGYSYQRARRRASNEFDDRIEVTHKEINAQIFYETARRTSVGFSTFLRKLRFADFDEPGNEIYYSKELDRDEKIGQIDLYYRVFSDSFFFVQWGFGDYEFVHQESIWKSSYTYYIYSGIQFPLLGRIRGVLSLGYKILDPYRANKKGFSDFVGSTRLEYRIRRFNFRFSYERDCEFSYWTSNVFFIEDIYGAGVSFYVNPFIRLDYDFSYGEAYYPEPEIFRLPDESYQEINREDTYLVHSVGLVIRVFRSTGIGLIASFRDRNSNIGIYDRIRVFIGGYLTYDF